MIWKDVYGEFLAFLLALGKDFSPQFQNSPIYVSDAFLFMLLAVTWLGFYNLLSRVYKHSIDVAVISVFLTLGTIGVVSILLGLASLLYTWNIALILLLFGITINAASLPELKRNLYSLVKAMRFSAIVRKEKLIITVPIVLTFGFSFFYNVFLPVTDFDALIYHAEMAKIMFEEHSIPLFKGPSIGIEISGNYPPLFSAVGAGLYTLMGRFDDVLLRILPAIFGLSIVMGVYRISEQVFPSSGRYSLLLMLSTPLFIHNLVISSPTSLIAACIVLAVYGVINLGSAFSMWDSPFYLHSILIGTFMGLALLSSYQSLYYILIPIVTFVILFLVRSNTADKHQMIKRLGLILVVSILLGSIWYSRNYIYHENPFYPWLFSPEGEEARIFEETEKEIQTVGSIVTFGKFDYDVMDLRTLFRFHPMLFPAFSAVSVVGIVLLLYKSPHKFSWLAVWMTLPILLIFGLGTIFPRYLLPLLPPLIISFGFMVAYAVRSISLYGKVVKATGLALVLLLYAFIGLPVAISNPAVNTGNYPDKMFFIKHAGNKEALLQAYYDGDVNAWQWINENASPEAKVATFDPRLYYMGDYRSIFPLDGREAIPLYSMRDHDEIKEFLQEHNIKYIFDASSPNSRLYYMLPLTQQLGSNEYPEILTPGAAHIYKVSNTITSNSTAN